MELHTHILETDITKYCAITTMLDWSWEEFLVNKRQVVPKGHMVKQLTGEVTLDDGTTYKQKFKCKSK